MIRIFFQAYLAAVCMVTLARATTDNSEADLDVNCETGLLDAMIMCYVSRDLSLTHVPGVESKDAQLIFRSLMLTPMDPLVSCGRKEVYYEAAACAIANIEFCMNPPFLVGLLPDVERLKQGMDVICKRQLEVDANCLKNYYDIVTDCTERTVQRLFQEDSERYQSLDVESLICLSSDVGYDCFEFVLGRYCDPVTASMYLEQNDRYIVPRICSDEERRPARPGRSSYVRSANALSQTGSATAVSGSAATLGVLTFLVCWMTA